MHPRTAMPRPMPCGLGDSGGPPSKPPRPPIPDPSHDHADEQQAGDDQGGRAQASRPPADNAARRGLDDEAGGPERRVGSRAVARWGRPGRPARGGSTYRSHVSCRPVRQNRAWYSFSMAVSVPPAAQRCAASGVADTVRGSPPMVSRGQMGSTSQGYGPGVRSDRALRSRIEPRGRKRPGIEIIPATTYFPRELPPEYLRRWRA